MAGFARDVTKPIDIPSVSSPDFSRNTSGVQDVASLLSFGIGIHEKTQALKAEEQRVATVNEGLALSKSLEEMQGEMSPLKFFQEAQKKIRKVGGGLIRQQQIGEIVAAQLGVKSLTGSVQNETEKLANNLEGEYKSLGDFGNFALTQIAPNSTFTELDNDTREKVIEKGLSVQADSEKQARDKQAGLTAMDEGNLNKVGAFFKADKEQFNSVGGVIISLYGVQLNQASESGIPLVAEDLLQMKESAKSVMTSMKTNLENQMSPDRLLKLPLKERTSVKGLLDARTAFYDDQIKFLDDMEADEFKNYADTTKLLQDADGLDLQRTVPELMKFKKLFGPQAMNLLVSETIAKKPEYRAALAEVTIKGFSVTGITKEDQFAVGMGIMAGIGEGRSIQDYDSDDASQAANVYWKTVDAFINTDGMIDNSNPDGITSMSIAAVQVLEYAEERGTVDDKKRALKMLNSPQFKQLYDKSPENIRNAMGRKVVQYNRDTFADTASRVVAELNTNISSVTYNVAQDRFVQINTQRDTPVASVGLEGGGVFAESKQRAKQDARVTALNHQLEVMKVYAKDDPFLSSLSPAEQAGFFIRSANLPNAQIDGNLPPLKQEQEQAFAEGVSVADLESRTDIVKSTGEVADLLADVERSFQDANIPEAMKKKAVTKMQAFLSGKDVEDTSDMTDEEFEQFLEEQRKARASK